MNRINFFLDFYLILYNDLLFLKLFLIVVKYLNSHSAYSHSVEQAEQKTKVQKGKVALWDGEKPRRTRLPVLYCPPTVPLCKLPTKLPGKDFRHKKVCVLLLANDRGKRWKLGHSLLSTSHTTNRKYLNKSPFTETRDRGFCFSRCYGF